MPKKPYVRTFMDGRHVKWSERLLKSARQYFRDVFSSLWGEISWKSSVLVVSEILRMFVDLLSPDEQYPLSVKTGD